MPINGVGPGSIDTYASEVRNTERLNTQNEVKQREAQKPAAEERRETPIQEKVEVRQRVELNEQDRIKENKRAEEVANQTVNQLKQNPNQAILAQGTNITPERVANLL